MKATTFKALENHPLVDEIIREYEEGEGYSYWLYLKSGYVFEHLGTTALHEPTKKRLISIFNQYQIIKDI
jgi:hypothetical protein